MRTLYTTVAFTAGILIAGCATQQRQQTISDNGAIMSAKGYAIAPPPPPPTKEPAFTADTRFAAGQLAESQGNPIGATIQYKEALKLQPNHLGAIYRLGIVYAQLKQYPQAIAAWEQYVKASNDAATAYADLGFCHELAGQPDLAITAYRAGIVHDPKSMPCHVNYGLLLARRGKIDQAVVQWRVVLSEAQIHYNLGSLYASQGHKPQARDEFKKALQLDPTLSDAQQRVAALDQE